MANSAAPLSAFGTDPGAGGATTGEDVFVATDAVARGDGPGSPVARFAAGLSFPSSTAGTGWADFVSSDDGVVAGLAAARSEE
jgi:hypothetical protein